MVPCSIISFSTRMHLCYVTNSHFHTHISILSWPNCYPDVNKEIISTILSIPCLRLGNCSMQHHKFLNSNAIILFYKFSFPQTYQYIIMAKLLSSGECVLQPLCIYITVIHQAKQVTACMRIYIFSSCLTYLSSTCGICYRRSKYKF